MAGAGLEAVLKISAKDETGGAFKALKAQVDAIDHQIVVFDRMAKAVGNVGPGADKLARSIGEMSRAMQEQRAAALELAEGLEATEGAAGLAAAGQARLRAAVLETTRTIAMQGGVAEREAAKMRAIGQKQAKEASTTRKEMVGIGGGIVASMLGFEAVQGFGKGIEAGATLDQTLAKLRATGVSDADIGQARAGYGDFTKSHGGMTESEYLTAYGEARTMSSDPLKTAREMALFSTALRNSGVETTPEEARSFVKAMDELSLSAPEQEKFLDRMVKVKQLYGSNITGETFLAAQRRSSMAAYGWDETFRENYFPFMLQSLGVTGGNDIMTAYSNVVGKHLQHTELMNLAKYGFIKPEDMVLNRVGDIKGVKPGAGIWEEATMKANPAQWAWDAHAKFMQRKGATEEQFTSFIGTLPRAMGAMIEFFTHGEGLAARDLALGKHPIGLAAAGNEYASQNPVAALASLRASIEQFGAALTSGPVQQAGAQLVALSKYVSEAAASVAKFEKDHPGVTKAATSGAEVAGGVLGLGLLAAGAKWLGRTALSGFGLSGLFGSGASGGAAAGGSGVVAGGSGVVAGAGGGARVGAGLLSRFGVAAGAASPLMDVVAPLLLAREAAELANPTTPAGAKYRVDTAWPSQTWDLERSMRAEREWRADPEAARGRAMMAPPAPPAPQAVIVSGSAAVDHTVHLDVNVTLDPALRAKIDQISNDSHEFTVPLIGGGYGRMDGDAVPHRSGGIGHR